MIQMPPVSRTLRRKGLSIHSRTALASRKVERKIIPKRKEPADHLASQHLSREELKRNAMLFKRPEFFFEPVCLTPPPAWTCELWSTTLEVHLHYFTEVVNRIPQRGHSGTGHHRGQRCREQARVVASTVLSFLPFCDW